MLDINSDNTKLMIILGEAGQLSLERIDLTTLKREVKIPKAQWLGHPAISRDDKYLALFVTDKDMNIDNQVLLVDSKGAKTVSEPVGNGWMLIWLGSHLAFTEQGKPVVFDPEKNNRVAPESQAGIDVSIQNKHKSGWPAKKSP